MLNITPQAKRAITPDLRSLRSALAHAEEPAAIRKVERELEGLEAMMRATGLYTDEQLREVRDERCRARWSLGRALEQVARSAGPGRGKKKLTALTSFSEVLKALSLTKPVALEAQRIGALPDVELEEALEAARKRGDLATFAELLQRARPYWFQAARKAKHRAIRSEAKARAGWNEAPLGPFPLIYADPPWKFAVYSPKGLARSPDQHYPTLTDDQIADFKVGGKSINQIAHKNAALFLWCTSSNVHRALGVMMVWGFEFKTSAAWDKVRLGAGLVFRNRHELLLYGTRGAMPGPQYQPPSLFTFERGRHSAKPKQIRRAIERMYPDFDASTRLELFARETVKGWTAYGYESEGAASL